MIHQTRNKFLKTISLTAALCFVMISLPLHGQTSGSVAKPGNRKANITQASQDTTVAKARKRAGNNRAANSSQALPNTTEFKATAAEMEAAMQAANALAKSDPLMFEKGNGLRILMTGHSWVAPGRKTLPDIAKAAGFDGHHQRTHTSGGASGSANSIWLTEFGKFKGKPIMPILLPAIATGQWDVMTWGAFYGDTPRNYSQWIEVCLKYNPGMVFYIQDGWPTYNPSLKDSSPEEALKAIDAMQTRLQEDMMKGLYDSLNVMYPGKVHIIPAGAAVVEMLHHYYSGELQGFDCISEHLGGKKGVYRDGGHLSSTSGMEYLVGYIYYGMLYRKSPTLISGYHPATIDPKLDQLMREASWKAITLSPFSGITDQNSDGVAD
jgi:hypothetical protein